MPGTIDLRAHAKWQQKCAKKNSTQVDANQRLLDSRTTIRNHTLKTERDTFEETFYENVLTHLRNSRKEDWMWIRGQLRHFVNFHVPFNIGAPIMLVGGRGKLDWFSDRMRTYVPYYEEGVRLSDRDFRESLDGEVKRVLREMRDERLRDAYGPFNRTLDRTDIIRAELLVVVNKFNCIRACKTVKEELVACAWHPDRVWKWIKAGRYLGEVNGEPEHAYNVLNMMAGYDSD